MCSFNELLQAVVKVLAQVLDVNCFDVISKLLPEPTKQQVTGASWLEGKGEGQLRGLCGPPGCK